MALFLKNLVFTILQPGLVAGLIPYLIIKEYDGVYQDCFPIAFWGYVLFIIGLAIMIYCIVSFGTRGLGTLSPAFPTQKLVLQGLYKYSRNPMYVGVLMILIGEAIVFKSIHLSVYTLLVFLGFHLFIIYFEEPRLKRDFGEEYKAYMTEVRRWI